MRTAHWCHSVCVRADAHLYIAGVPSVCIHVSKECPCIPLFLPNIDNANLSFSSLIFSPPSLCARSTVAVKSTQWVFVQRTQRSVCSCWVELAESLLETLPGAQQTIVNGLKRAKRAFEAFWGCVKGKSNVGWVHSQSHSCSGLIQIRMGHWRRGQAEQRDCPLWCCLPWRHEGEIKVKKI